MEMLLNWRYRICHRLYFQYLYFQNTAFHIFFGLVFFYFLIYFFKFNQNIFTLPSWKVFCYKKGQILTLDHFDSGKVLLSALVERFSVFRMRDFFVDISKVPYACDNVPYSLLSYKKRKTNPFGPSYFQLNVFFRHCHFFLSLLL